MKPCGVCVTALHCEHAKGCLTYQSLTEAMENRGDGAEVAFKAGWWAGHLTSEGNLAEEHDWCAADYREFALTTPATSREETRTEQGPATTSASAAPK